MTDRSLVRVFAPAKINLALHVVGRRPDGYHLLDSLVAFSDYGDQIAIRAAARDDFSVAGSFASGVPTSNQNLVLKARDLLRHAAGVKAFPVHIHLDKRLPIASGIGGGSSDAAATLRGLCELWDFAPAPQQLHELALQLGADVPMCLLAGAAHVGGIGDIVRPVSGLPQLAAVLVNPGVAVATPAVFARLEHRSNPSLPDLPRGSDVWLRWLRDVRNDLEAPAVSLVPVIADALHALKDSGAINQRMSGSGATCFGLYPSLDAANKAAALLAEHHPNWFVQPTLLA